MFKFCPATGRLAHRFDKTTHRCACGRWERGFKPKVEPKTPRAECQVCERTQALAGGVLVHHGYQRPGCGFIVGDCRGAGHAPYPATDALEKYLKELGRIIDVREGALAAIPGVTETEYRWSVRKKGGGSETRVRTVRRGDPVEYTGPNGGYHTVPSFADLMRARERALKADLAAARGEAARCEARVAAAKTLTAEEALNE